jgi:dienelactone hydrolase
MMPTVNNNNSDNPTNEGASNKSSSSTIHKRNTLQHIQWWSNFLLKGFAFVLCLLPGYCRLFYYYIISSDRICVRYGECARNYLDVYGSGRAAESSAAKETTSSGGGNNDTANTTTATTTKKKKKPVLIFICGGTWQIHQRYYAMGLGRALSPLGILVIVPDYRPYTSSSSSKKKEKNDSNHVSIKEMIDDVDSSVDWVLNNVEEYGGDKEKVMLVGQSAGGHLVGLLAALKMLDWVQQHCQQRRQRRQEGVVAAAGDNDEEQQQQQQPQQQQQQPWLKSTYTPRQLLGYVPTAGPLNLIDLKAEYLNSGMMSPHKMNGLFGGQSNEALAKWSPHQVMQRCCDEYSATLQEEVELGQEGGGDAKVKKEDCGVVFPRICAIHGTGDTCVPSRTSEEFVKELSTNVDNMEVELITYDGWSHTDPIIEKPMVSTTKERMYSLFECIFFKFEESIWNANLTRLRVCIL